MMSPTPPPSASSKEELRLLWQMSGLAFQFGTEIIAGVLLGWGFDALFGTRPWGVLIGSLAGIAVGTADLIRRAIKINRQMDQTNPIKGTRGAKPGGTPIAPLTDKDGKAAGNNDDDLIDPEFDEALNHEQWKKVQDRKLDSNDDDRDKPDGP